MLLDGIYNWDAMLTNNVLMRDKRFDTLSPIIRTDKRKNNKHFQLRLSQLSLRGIGTFSVTFFTSANVGVTVALTVTCHYLDLTFSLQNSNYGLQSLILQPYKQGSMSSITGSASHLHPYTLACNI